MKYGYFLVLLLNQFFTFAYAVDSATCSLISPTKRCSCFKISRDLIGTSLNCVDNVKDAYNTKVNFTQSPLEWKKCNTLVTASKFYGLSVLKCDILMSNNHEIINHDEPINTDNLYVTSYNCNTRNNPHCRPSKESNLCKVTGRSGIFDHIYHLKCDTDIDLDGSPVFLFDTEHTGEFVCVYSADGTNQRCRSFYLKDLFPYYLLTKPYDFFMFFRSLIK